MKHCNKELKIQTGKENGKDMFYAICEVCGLKYKHENKMEIWSFFEHPHNIAIKKKVQQNTLPAKLQPLPKDKNTIKKWASDNMPALINQSATFIDKPATSRMIEKNIRYISNLDGKSWNKIWASPEGRESISNAHSEALYHGATLGDMGDLVPFGSTAEFIPNVECYKFALGTGRNAPFKDISIDIVHEHDQTTNDQVDGHFVFTLKRGIPRGEVVAIVVQGVRTDNDKNVGEIYDASRLIEKAKTHSPSYRSYLMEKEEFQKLKTEGKLKQDNVGRYFMEKIIKYQKNGQEKSFTKEIYEHDIVNPYEGPDRPEMLRKSAGKSFFRPYMKVRNAVAMSDEWDQDDSVNDEVSRDKAADNVLSKAAEQFENIQDAEIIPEKEKSKEKEVEKNLFDENDDSINKL